MGGHLQAPLLALGAGKPSQSAVSAWAAGLAVTLPQGRRGSRLDAKRDSGWSGIRSGARA